MAHCNVQLIFGRGGGLAPLMYVITYQKGKMCAGRQKHLIHAERESHKDIPFADISVRWKWK